MARLRAVRPAARAFLPTPEMNIRSKLTLLLCTLSLFVIATAGIFSTLTLDNYFRSRIIDELRTQADEFAFLLRSDLLSDSSAYGRLQELARSANIRLTLVEADGVVVFESEIPRDKLPGVENHLQRPEIQEALRNGTGMSSRRSSTLSIEMLYLAKRIDQPFSPASPFAHSTFLRTGIPMNAVEGAMEEIRSKIIIVSVITLGIVCIVSLLVARKISHPITEMAAVAEQIRQGNLEQRIQRNSTDELGRLAASLNGMVDKLNKDIVSLKKLERVRSEFLGNVSHELRTPIFAIQGMLETLLAGALNDKEVRRNFVERALANAQRLNELIGDLIEISRIESGEMRMSFRRFPLRELLEQSAAEMAPAAAQKDVQVDVSTADQTLEVLADRDRIKQVIINLIDNAIKYNRPGGRVIISCERIDGEVAIEVQDTGIGIPEEHLPRIFERFYRVDKQRSRDAGGTGLGLAIVKHIVEAHGSSVSVRSTPNEGTTFSFTLKS